MPPSLMHFQRICRICLSTSEKLSNLFHSEENVLRLLQSMTELSFSANDDLPQNICPFCSHQIKSAQDFIWKCRQSDRKLRQSLKDAAENDNFPSFSDENEPNDNFRYQHIVKEECNVETFEIENKQSAESPHLESAIKQGEDEVLSKALKINCCIVCQIEYLCNDAYLEHMKTHEQNKHTDSQSVDEPLVQPTVSIPANSCHVCNKSFAKRKSFERHKSLHDKPKSNETPFQCSLCGKQMKHVNNYKIHMKSHRRSNSPNASPNSSSDNKKKYLCSTCGRACTSQSNLAVHTRRHTGTMTNFCTVCGKGYPRSTD